MNNTIHVFACGSNAHFEAGFPTKNEKTSLHEIVFPPAFAIHGVRSLAAGISYSALVDSNGILYTWGQLNHNKFSGEFENYIPQIASFFVENSIHIKEVSTINEHAAVVSDDGKVYIWGNNSQRHFPVRNTENDGIQENVPITNPIEISLESHAVSVKCGGYFTMILTEKGEVWVCGVNGDDGIGIPEHYPIYQSIETPQCIPQTSFRDMKIVEIAAGWNHMIALSENGIIFSWGRKKTGRLGRDSMSIIDMIHFDPSVRISHIFCSHNDTYGISDLNELYGCGWNEGGQHGNGMKRANRIFKKLNEEQNIVSISGGSDDLGIILSNGIVKVSGSNQNGKLGLDTIKYSKTFRFTPIDKLANCIQIAMGYSHTLFVTN